MSFKFKEKTIYLSLVSIITVIFSITFCIMMFYYECEYRELFKTMIALIVGFFFNDNLVNNNNQNKGDK